MKRFLSIFTISTILLLTACSGCTGEKEHSHGPDGDHTHEVPATQSSNDDSEPTRIGGGEQTHDADSTHSHDDDGDHNDGENTDHSHDEDTHSHGDEEHSHN
jgi:hypothetical protein